MTAYFVRLKKDRQVVGIYSAETIEVLRELVDECTDPAGCELLEMGDGGLYKCQSIAGQFPPRISDEPDYETNADDAAALNDAQFTDGWNFTLATDAGWEDLGPLHPIEGNRTGPIGA